MGLLIGMLRQAGGHATPAGLDIRLPPKRARPGRGKQAQIPPAGCRCLYLRIKIASRLPETRLMAMHDRTI